MDERKHSGMKYPIMMTDRNRTLRPRRRPLAAVLLLLFAASWVPYISAQQSQSPEEQLQNLQHQMDQLSQQLQQAQKEIDDLRKQLQAATQNKDAHTVVPPSPAPPSPALDELKDQQAVQQAEIQQQQQTKVETSSKYPLTIHGLLLFNSFLNDGGVDSIDLPFVAVPVAPGSSSGNAGATLRQTILGLHAEGPHFWHARSSADLDIDFFGGLANTDYTSNAGVLRLRTANLRFDWHNDSIFGGFDSPIFSPLSPTSYAMVGEPPLAWQGNLWAWAPQINYEHRQALRHGNRWIYQIGLYDPAAPGLQSSYTSRQASPAEASKRPATETLLEWQRGSTDRLWRAGVGGYYSPHRYPEMQNISSWAVGTDWQFPIVSRITWSGEIYRGQAIGDLGGGVFKDTTSFYNPATDAQTLHGLNDAGGWSQLSFSPLQSLEFNMALGLDNGFANELNAAQRSQQKPAPLNVYSGLARNRAIYGNIVYRPREYWIFSAEYRALNSWGLTGAANTANIYTLTGGYSF